MAPLRLEVAEQLDLDGVPRRERRMSALGSLRKEAAVHAHEVRLAEARARGEKGGISLGILRPRVHDGEVGR